MTVELHELILGLAAQAVTVADSVVSSVSVLYAAGASNGLDAGPLAAGAAAGAAAGGAAAAGGGRGDRGFRYSSGGTVVSDSPGGTATGTAPDGLRLPYDSVVRDAGGNVTHYHVNPPGMSTGYVPAGSTSDTPPTYRPLPAPSWLRPRDAHDVRSISPNTASGRG